MPNQNPAREDRGRRRHKIHRTRTASNAVINLNPPARQGSALPGRGRGDDRSGILKGHLAPEQAGRATLRPRHSIRAVGERGPSSVPAKELMAGCGWFL